jgi:hypothetical protein
MSLVLVSADVLESILALVSENTDAGFVIDCNVPDELIPALDFILWNQLDEEEG